jgi:hypothetical protein
MSIGSSQSETRVVLSGISWPTFESILAETKNHGTRFTYDRGHLETMSPSREYKRAKRFIGRMIEDAAATESRKRWATGVRKRLLSPIFRPSQH